MFGSTRSPIRNNFSNCLREGFYRNNSRSGFQHAASRTSCKEIVTRKTRSWLAGKKLPRPSRPASAPDFAQILVIDKGVVAGLSSTPDRVVGADEDRVPLRRDIDQTNDVWVEVLALPRRAKKCMLPEASTIILLVAADTRMASLLLGAQLRSSAPPFHPRNGNSKLRRRYKPSCSFRCLPSSQYTASALISSQRILQVCNCALCGRPRQGWCGKPHSPLDRSGFATSLLVWSR